MPQPRFASTRALAVIVGLAAAPLAHANPPTDAQVHAFIEHIQKAGAAETDPAKRAEAKRDAARHELETISIAEATWSQIDDLQKKVGKASPELAAALEARTAALVSAALDEPTIADRLKSGNADRIVSAAAKLPVSTLAKHHILDRLAPLITPDLPPKTVMILDGMAHPVMSHRAELGDKPVETFRTNMIAAITEAHAKQLAKRAERLKKVAVQKEQNKNNPNANELNAILDEYSAKEQRFLDDMLATKAFLSSPATPDKP